MFTVNAYFSDQFSVTSVVISTFIHYKPGTGLNVFHKLCHVIVPKLLWYCYWCSCFTDTKNWCSRKPRACSKSQLCKVIESRFTPTWVDFRETVWALDHRQHWYWLSEGDAHHNCCTVSSQFKSMDSTETYSLNFKNCDIKQVLFRLNYPFFTYMIASTCTVLQGLKHTLYMKPQSPYQVSREFGNHFMSKHPEVNVPFFGK